MDNVPDIVVDTYRDGGTVCVKIVTANKQYCVNRMLRTESCDAVFPCYPTEGEPITPDQFEDAIFTLMAGAKHCRAPNEVMAIGKGLEWIYEQKRLQNV